MTIPLTGAGSWGVRVGHLGGYLNDILSLYGGSSTTNVASGSQPATRKAQIEADYAAGTAAYDTIEGFAAAINNFIASAPALVTDIQSRIVNTTIDMANLDFPLPDKTIAYALQLLIQQMTGVATINASAPAVGAQTAIGSPTGNAKFIFSVLDTAGRTQQYVFPETLVVNITTDAQEGATAGQEAWSMVGQNAQTNKLAPDWLATKYGSGAKLTGNLVDGSVSNTGGTVGANINLSNNGDFTDYTSTDYPDNWIITVGVATTDVSDTSGSVAYLTGGGSVQLKGDGATLVGIAQAFSTPTTTITSGTGAGTGGSPVLLKAGVSNNTQYCANVFYKLSGASPATGTLRLSVTDGSNTILTNDNGDNLSTTVDLTAVADTNWHNVSLCFSLPKSLPSGIRIRIDQSAALESGKHVYLANFAVCEMQQLYNGGPYVASFRGNTNVNASGIAPDSWKFAVTNTHGVLQKVLWRTIDPANVSPPNGNDSPYFTPGNGYVIPADGSPTVADSVVA